jgi:rare lipoprotein A
MRKAEFKSLKQISKSRMNNLKIFLFAALVIIACQKGFSQTSEIGLASFYNDKFEGKKTASGQVYDQRKLTAAHRTLPFNTRLRVTNLKNKRTIIVTVNDRGPFVKGRILDLSKAAAIKLDFIENGVTKIMLEILSDE